MRSFRRLVGREGKKREKTTTERGKSISMEQMFTHKKRTAQSSEKGGTGRVFLSSSQSRFIRKKRKNILFQHPPYCGEDTRGVAKEIKGHLG